MNGVDGISLHTWQWRGLLTPGGRPLMFLSYGGSYVLAARAGPRPGRPAPTGRLRVLPPFFRWPAWPGDANAPNPTDGTAWSPELAGGPSGCACPYWAADGDAVTMLTGISNRPIGVLSLPPRGPPEGSQKRSRILVAASSRCPSSR